MCIHIAKSLFSHTKQVAVGRNVEGKESGQIRLSGFLIQHGMKYIYVKIIDIVTIWSVKYF